MKIPLVGAEVFHADRLRDMMKLTVAFAILQTCQKECNHSGLRDMTTFEISEMRRSQRASTSYCTSISYLLLFPLHMHFNASLMMPVHWQALLLTGLPDR